MIDTIYDTLLPHCSYLDWEAEPSVLTVANVQHLATRDGGPAVRAAAVGARRWRRELSPTPALGGAPARRRAAR